MFSMAILLGKQDIDISAPYLEDSLLDSLKSYNNSHMVAIVDNAKLAFPKIFQEFFQCVQGELDEEALKSYIDKKWYPSNRGEAWYDADKRSKGTYCGYWCFVGAAVAKIRGFGAEDFVDCIYFPVDLLRD